MSSSSSRSSAATVSEALDEAERSVAGVLARLGRANAVVLIDGRSGAGKSSLTRRLVHAWPGPGPVQQVALDSLYPGWDGLDAGADAARDQILLPHRQALVGKWRSWDWDQDRFADEHEVDPAAGLIVEGSGILRPSTATLGDVRVWLESPADSRRERALARDGETYRPHWERWAAQEALHIARDDPRSLADVIVEVP